MYTGYRSVGVLKHHSTGVMFGSIRNKLASWTTDGGRLQSAYCTRNLSSGLVIGVRRSAAHYSPPADNFNWKSFVREYQCDREKT